MGLEVHVVRLAISVRKHTLAGSINGCRINNEAWTVQVKTWTGNQTISVGTKRSSKQFILGRLATARQCMSKVDIGP